MNMPITVCSRLVHGFVVVVDDDDRNAGLRERNRNPASHRAGADDAGLCDRQHLGRREGPSIFDSSRSAKKRWRNASDGSERTSSSKSRASRAIPKLNGSSIDGCDGVDEFVRGEPAVIFGRHHFMRLRHDERRRLHRKILWR